MKRKLVSGILVSLLMATPAFLVGCGDDDVIDDNEKIVDDNAKVVDDTAKVVDDTVKVVDDTVKNEVTVNNSLLGTWINTDSTKEAETLWSYVLFEKDYYYDVNIKQQGSVQIVDVFRFSYTFDGENFTLPCFQDSPVKLIIEGDTCKTPATVFTRVSGLPQVALDKIAAGDFVDTGALCGGGGDSDIQ